MKNIVLKIGNSWKGWFILNMNNFEVSLSYEGFILKKSNDW